MVSGSASMGNLHHLRGWCSADSDLLSVHLHLLLQRKEEAASEER